MRLKKLFFRITQYKKHIIINNKNRKVRFEEGTKKDTYFVFLLKEKRQTKSLIE
jgi:hypothetical protein